MDIVNRKVAIDLTIRSACVPSLKDPTEVYIEWQRGTKHIDTKTREIDPSSSPLAVFNEKFQMKTMLEFDPMTSNFQPKKSVLALFRKRDKILLGQTNFDLSIYANKGKAMGDKLFLDEIKDAYIEIYIKA